MCECLLVNVHVCVHVGSRWHVRACVQVYAHVCVCVCACVCACVLTVDVLASVHVCVHVCACVCMCVHVRTVTFSLGVVYVRRLRPRPSEHHVRQPAVVCRYSMVEGGKGKGRRHLEGC